LAKRHGWEKSQPVIFRKEKKMKFGEAIDLAKQGKKITREGWNGKGQFVYYQEGSVIDPAQARNPVLAAFEGPITLRPHLDLKTADGSIQIGWIASQSDALADDWALAD
jgi:hypothetical protein